MEPIIIYIVIGVAALILAYYWVNWYSPRTQKRIEEAEQQAIEDHCDDGQVKAETPEKGKLEAKENSFSSKADHDCEVMQRNQKISESENCIKQKEQFLNQKDQNLGSRSRTTKP